MRAVVCRRYGGTDGLTIEERPTPTPVRDQVLVRVRAASINDFDLGLMRGAPLVVRFFNGFLRPKVRVLGCDVAGRVEAVGPSVKRLSVGDDVLGDLSGCGFGAFAEYVCAPESALVVKPPSVTFDQAAALPQAGVLAVQGLFGIDPVRSGQRVLLNGAGGGVGTLGLQLARRRGAIVTCVDSADKLDMLSELGADRVMDYRTTDFTRTGDEYDLIVDAKTSRSPFAYARALAPGGHYATVGGSMKLITLLMALRSFIARSRGRHLHMIALKPNWRLDCLAELVGTGELTPVLDQRTFTLDQVPAALDLFESATHLGKVIVRVE